MSIFQESSSFLRLVEINPSSIWFESTTPYSTPSALFPEAVSNLGLLAPETSPNWGISAIIYVKKAELAYICREC